MTTFDAIVVGAGPAGSTAARLLAQQGARVLCALVRGDTTCAEFRQRLGPLRFALDTVAWLSADG